MGTRKKRVDAVLDKIGLVITNAVGTMWCAIAFVCLTLVSLPGAIATHDPVIIINWIAQTFLQLVLLSIIMVGGRLQSAGTEQLILDTHKNMLAEIQDNKAEIKLLTQIANALHIQLTGESHPALTGEGVTDNDDEPPPAGRKLSL